MLCSGAFASPQGSEQRLRTFFLPIRGWAGFGNELGSLCQSLVLSANLDELSNVLQAYNKMYVSSPQCAADMPIALQLAA